MSLLSGRRRKAGGACNIRDARPVMNAWWRDYPNERYWMVSTDHDGRGHGLIAWRMLDGSSRAPWHHSLIMLLKPGDRVFHYWSSTSSKQPQSIVAYSTVAADPQEGEYSWDILGKDRDAGLRHPPGTPAFVAALEGWTWLEPAVSLRQVRNHETELRILRDQIRKCSQGAPYFPWSFHANPPRLQPAQAYLMKLPDRARELLGLPGLR